MHVDAQGLPGRQSPHRCHRRQIRRGVCELSQERARVPADDLHPARHQRLGLGLADELPLVRISGEQHAGDTQVLEGLQYRVVKRTAGTASAAHDEHVQSDIGCLRKQGRQRLQRVAARCGDQIVIVHQHIGVGARPPRAVAQLLRGHVRARDARGEELRELAHRRAGLVMVRQVLAEIFLADLVQQGPSIVDQEYLGLAAVAVVIPFDLARDETQERGFAGS